MSAPEEFVHRQRGGCYAFAVLMMIFPVMLVFGVLEAIFGEPWVQQTLTIQPGPLPVGVIVGLALLVYFAFGSENRVVIDDQGLRFSHTRKVLGFRRGEKVLWALAASALTSAREVTTRSPSSRGGWNTAVVLHLPEGRKILEIELGMKGTPSSAYDAFVASLERRLGDRFTTEQVT